jgi:hypothetical protein
MNNQQQIKDADIEEIISVLTNPAYKGSYAAPREAIRNVLRRILSQKE